MNKTKSLVLSVCISIDLVYRLHKRLICIFLVIFDHTCFFFFSVAGLYSVLYVLYQLKIMIKVFGNYIVCRQTVELCCPGIISNQVQLVLKWLVMNYTHFIMHLEAIKKNGKRLETVLCYVAKQMFIAKIICSSAFFLFVLRELFISLNFCHICVSISDTIAAMDLPMACTLSHFSNSNTYYFAVRGKDIYGRYGSFSKPCNSKDIT